MLRFVYGFLIALFFDVQGGHHDYTCYPNQTIHFNNPNPGLLTNYRAFYNDGSGSQECTSNTPDNHLNVYFYCSSTNYSITAYFSDRNLTDDIIGGEGVQFTVRCNQLEAYIQTFIGNLTAVSVSHKVESTTPEHDIICFFNSYNFDPITTATVGDVVYFSILSPVEYTLKPLSCIASGGNDSKTVITNGCSEDTNLVGNFYMFKKRYTDINKKMYTEIVFKVFKFYNADDVTLTCSVKVCISGDCSFSCGSGRRKRAFSKEDDDDEEVITLTKRLIIKEAVLGGSSRANGLWSLTVAMLRIVLVWMKAL